MNPLRVTAVLTLALTAACGTTVPLAQQTTGGAQGLGGVSAGTSGSDLGTGTTGTTGTGGTPLGGTSAGSVLGGGTAGSSTSGATGSASTSGGSAGGASGVAGSARVKTPLKLGVLVTDIGAAVRALGASSGNRAADDGYKALVSAFNALGGFSGRKIEPTYQVVNALDNNYQTDAQSTCSTFKDAKVEIVLSDAASTDYGVAACLWEAHIPMITTVASDKTALAKAPQVFSAFTPTLDSGYGAVVDRLAASGYLSRKNKIGFIRISCPAMEAAYNNTVLPRIRAAGLATPIDYTVSCASGFQDAGAYSAAMQSAVLRFRSAGVDRVFVMGAQENLLLQYFAEQAQNQDFHPGYALSSGSAPVTLIDASTFPQQQLPQVHGVGWHPLSETGVDRRTASDQRCITLGTKGGLKPANITEVFGMYMACSNMFLLETVIKNGNGSASYDALRRVIPALGSSFASTGIINGLTQFAPGRQNGPRLANEWGFNSSCTCFRYVGTPAAMR